MRVSGQKPGPFRTGYRSLFLLPLVVVLLPAGASAQERSTAPTAEGLPESPAPARPDQQTPPQNPQPQSPASPSGAGDQQPSTPKTANTPAPPANPEPPRILGIMPNFRAVSAGTIPPPPTPRQAFVIATKNSFDYSSFIFVGITSLLAEATNTHAQLGKGLPGFGRYYWRGFVDKTDGNYLVIFAFPTVFHEDERYYAMGTGDILKRALYAASRVAITPNYQGHSTFNAAELLGRGVSQAVSLSYYPSQTRTFGGIASKFGYAVGRDALTNTFREFWPDIAVHVLHRQP
jgi:hypothetical protein